MGEIADMMIEGFLDHQTGEFIDGDSPGYPRSVDSVKKRLFLNYKNCKELNGILKFFRSRNYSQDLDHLHEPTIIALIRGYCKIEHEFEGTLKECAKLIQNDNFGSFIDFVNSKKSAKIRKRKD